MSTPRADTTLDALLDFVKDARGFDFTGYKRSTIQRRVAKRMAAAGVERYDDYLDYLEMNGDEYVELFNALLINTTGFFRDPQTWEYLASEIVPQLLADRAPDSPLRVWCAGCASGEEPYTVAMVLARVIGDAGFRERAKIYATDVDEEALDLARRGAYLPRQIENVPPEALDRFFERTDRHYLFRRDLRRSVIFGRNDLVQDAPISRIDLLACRNTLMYFTAETQSQILRRFHFALDEDDQNRSMVMTNDAARRVFGLSPNDVGRPIQGLELPYRPLELRGHLDTVDRDLRPSEIKAVQWRAGDAERIFDVRFTPLGADGDAMGTSIAYLDVTEAHRIQDQLAGSKRALEQAYEELETTNEELRSRTQEVNDVNSFVETLLSTIGLAVAVLDLNQRVRIWNVEARSLWGLRADQARDEHLMALEFGLPVVQLRRQIRDCLSGQSTREEIILDATDRSGHAFRCRRVGAAWPPRPCSRAPAGPRAGASRSPGGRSSPGR